MNRKQRRADKSHRQQKPDPVAGLYALAFKHHQAGQLEQAEQLYRRVLATDPRHAGSLHLLGLIAYQFGRYNVAVAMIGDAIAINDRVASFHINIGNAYSELGQPSKAEASYRRALLLEPGSALASNNLGTILQAQGKLEEAIIAYEETLALAPDMAEAHNNLGSALCDLGRHDDVLAHYARAVEITPDYAEAQHNIAFFQLLTGDFGAGWPHYEWRHRMAGARVHNHAVLLWDGGDLSGRTILLTCEQGLGDSIQFIRYAPLVKAKGGRVILSCPAPLVRLFATVAGLDQIIPEGAPLPAYDCYAPLMSLPGLFKTDLASIPAPVPYLHPEASLVAVWQHRLAGFSGKKVGIVWRGSATHKNDRNRSMTARDFTTFLTASDITVVNLQKDTRPDEAVALSDISSFFDAAPHLTDLADTAALITELDLVIAVDTAVCHLAGALGKPVWTLIPFAPDWRWLLGRTDSPWYPGMHLMRQPVHGDWGSVIKSIQDRLRSEI